MAEGRRSICRHHTHEDEDAKKSLTSPKHLGEWSETVRSFQSSDIGLPRILDRLQLCFITVWANSPAFFRDRLLIIFHVRKPQ